MSHSHSTLVPNASLIARVGRVSNRISTSIDKDKTVAFCVSFVLGICNFGSVIVAIINYVMYGFTDAAINSLWVTFSFFVLFAWLMLGFLYDSAKLPGVIEPSYQLNEFLKQWEKLPDRERKGLMSLYREAFKWEAVDNTPNYHSTNPVMRSANELASLNSLLLEQRKQALKAGLGEDSLNALQDKVNAVRQVNSEIAKMLEK